MPELGSDRRDRPLVPPVSDKGSGTPSDPSSAAQTCGIRFNAFDGPQKCGRLKDHQGAHTRDPLPGERRELLREISTVGQEIESAAQGRHG